MVINYNTTKGRFESAWAFDEFKVAYPVVKGAGFKFDGNVNPKTWHTADLAIAAKLRTYMTPEALEALGDVQPAPDTKQSSLVASRAKDSLAEVPAPAGLSYLPFQKAGITYAMDRPSTLIADEMGLGKTIQAIGVSNTDPTARKILVICPASLKLNWRKEWSKWDVKGLTVDLAGKTFPTTDVVIVNYDIIKKWHDRLAATTWDLLIVDECHKVKNPQAIRTQYILGKKAGKKKVAGKMVPTEPISPIPAKRRVFLTGTPICNRPIELWPLVEALDPDGLGKSFFGFAKRYCNAVQNRFGWDFKGASNLDELQERLRSTIMVRRLKSAVLTDLPAKRRTVTVLEIEDAKGRELVEREKAAYDNLMLDEGDGVALADMSRVRHEVAVYKLPYVIKALEEKLEDDGLDKLVVMAHHRDVVEGLKAHFGDVATMVHGDVSLKDRDAAVERFQGTATKAQDPTCKLFIGTIQAAGVGLTLTIASTVVFAELDWVPGNVTQAEDRCHRIGQHDAVNVEHIVLDESLDAKLANTIIDKQVVIDAALDNAPKAKAPLEMPKVGLPEPVDEKKAAVVTMKDGSQVTLTPEQIQAIHTGLQMLRGRCDGAVQEDGRGFSGLDVQFGWSLAAAPKLSPKMAAHGQKMIRKYQGQLPTELVLAAGVTPKERAA